MIPNKYDYLAAINTVEHTHSAPAVIAQVLPLLRREDVMLQEIVHLLRVDASLTAEIIRTSNSVLLHCSEPAVSLDEAVGRLGLDEVLCHVALSLARDTMTTHLKYYNKRAESLQRESIACALIMEQLAKSMRLNPGEAYTMGILHAVGYLVLNQVLADFDHIGCWNGQEPIEEWEVQTTGFDHAEAGSYLLKNWSFPPEFCRAVARQLESPEKLPTGSFELALCVARQLFPSILSERGENDMTKVDFELIEKAIGTDRETLTQMTFQARQSYLELIDQLSGV